LDLTYETQDWAWDLKSPVTYLGEELYSITSSIPFNVNGSINLVNFKLIEKLVFSGINLISPMAVS
jgi:hypothetical protein